MHEHSSSFGQDKKENCFTIFKSSSNSLLKSIWTNICAELYRIFDPSRLNTLEFLSALYGLGPTYLPVINGHNAIWI